MCVATELALLAEMKEDAQLVCPISYDDQSGLWSKFEEQLLPRFPIKDITCKNPINGSQIIIDKLPVRCMPPNATIFKDVDHPFRWFLAPYIQIYVISCENTDAYKTLKVKLRQWVEGRTGTKRASWLILYLPNGTQPLELYQKIYSKLASDFYQDRSGDRTAIFYVNGYMNRGVVTLPANNTNSLTDVVNKIRDGIVSSFLLRCNNYDTEIRKLDGMRGTPELDFRQLFLVKESLALMYQMMQLPNDSLAQYEELEALLSFASLASLPTNEWPLIPVDFGTSNKKSKSKTSRESVQAEDIQEVSSNSVPQSETEPVLQPWTNAYQHGLSILTYSINYTRMKVLKNRVSIIELSHYVFARQAYFLFTLGKIPLCAEKGYKFITTMHSSLIKRLDEVKRGSAIDDLKNAVLGREKRIDSPPPQTESSLLSGSTSSGIPVVHMHGKSSVGGLHASTLVSSITQLPTHGESNESKNKLKEIAVMIGLWSVIASIQLVCGCREQYHHALSSSASNQSANDSSSTSPVFLRSRTISGASNHGSSNLLLAKDISQSNVMESSTSARTVLSPPIHESVATKIRDASRFLSDLLFFAKDILSEIFQYHQYLAESHSMARHSFKQSSIYYEYRRLALEISKNYQGWNSFDELIGKYPAIFIREPSQSDDDLLPSVLSTTQETGDNIITKPNREHSKQKLFGETIENLEETAGNFNRKLLKFINEIYDTQSNFYTSFRSVEQQLIQRTTDTHELYELTADMTVIINRLIAEHEEIAGRWRFAAKAKVDCADVLLCRGKFLLAETYLNSAVSNTPLVNTAITPMIVLPPNPLPSSNTNTLQSSSLLSDPVAYWGQLRIWTLWKKLICSRYNLNKLEYLKTSLVLLEPHLSKYLTIDNLSALHSDLVKNCFPFHSSSLTPRGENIPRFINLSSDQHFGFTIMMNTPHVLRHKDSPYPCMTVTNTTKHLHDENFQVRIAKCLAGQPYVIYLRITSEFRYPIEVDDIVVTYTPFQPSQFSSSTTPSSPTLKPTISSLNQSSSAFDCKPLDNLRNSSNKFTISNDQILELLFSPLSCGEYMLQKIVVRIDDVLFEKQLTVDINRLQPFFSTNILISVINPPHVFDVKPLVPIFTPINQRDSFGLQIKSHPYDRIDSLFIKLSSPQSMSPLSSPITPSRLNVSRDTNDIGSSRPESTQLPQLAKDTNFYESTLRPTLTKPRSSSHSGPQALRINNTPLFELGSPDSWIVKCVKYEGDDHLPEAHNPRIDIKSDGILLTNLQSTEQLNIICPYQFSLPSPQSRVVPQRYSLKYSLQGTLIRNGCHIEYEMSDNFIVSGGEQLLIDQTTTELFGNGYYCQFIFTNVSKQSLRLLPFQIFPYSTGNNHYEIHCDSDSDDIQTKTPYAIPSTGIIILPSQKYYLGMYLEYHQAILPTSKPVPRTSQSFLYSHINQENIKKESAKLQQILSAPPKLVDIVLSVQRTSDMKQYSYGEEKVREMTTQLLPLLSAEEYFNSNIFKYPLTINPPLGAISSTNNSQKVDFHLEIQVQREMMDPSATATGTTSPSYLFRIGEPITCLYTLHVIYPPECQVPTGNTPTPTNNSTNAASSQLLLSIGIGVGGCRTSNSSSQEWMALGITTRQVVCSPENAIITFPLQLLPIASGSYSFPPILVSVGNSNEQMKVYPDNDEVLVEPRNHAVVILASTK